MKVKINQEDLQSAGLNRKMKRYLLNNSKRFAPPSIKDVTWSYFTENSKVKLNYDRIMERSSELNEGYISFVEEHKNDVLTVYQADEYQGTSLYCFREDSGEVPWTFDASDLELVEMAGVKEFTIK